MLVTRHYPYSLKFKFDAGTSRGVLKEKETHFIEIWEKQNPQVKGLGETGLFRGLSCDDSSGFVNNLLEALQSLSEKGKVNLRGLRENPSVAIAIEMALLDMKNGGNRILFSSEFTEGKKSIPINGLIWMGEKDVMRRQIVEKIDAGFDCIKMKIGAIDFETELKLLGEIRKEFKTEDITLRVDANGAFAADEALENLKRLSEYSLHSIEQPIKKGQWEIMTMLCERSPLPIALDEELTGINQIKEKERLLKAIKPQYIILKPSLLGGFQFSEEWIKLADSLNIGWWVTSALESNIGLNAIAQWTANLGFKGHQGLGTGQLYSNNIPSPLQVSEGYLHYKQGENQLERP